MQTQTSLYDFKNFEFVKLGNALHLIGSGAFSEVYLAKNIINNKFYAIKILNLDKATKKRGYTDLIQIEISIHRKLVHDNIVRLYAHYQVGSKTYLIMDYAANGTLYQKIKFNANFDEKDAFKYFIQIVSAVSFLHEHNFIHRDLKPENVLLDEHDNALLCDFGCCMELKNGNRNRNRITFSGASEYMAPELIKELPYNKGVDVWSLGVILYELLHGYSPFNQNKELKANHSLIFSNILKKKCLVFKSNVSEDCKDLISKLLTTDNEKRFKVGDILFHKWVVAQKEKKERNRIDESKIKYLIDCQNHNSERVMKLEYQSNDSLLDKVLNNIIQSHRQKKYKSLSQRQLKCQQKEDNPPLLTVPHEDFNREKKPYETNMTESEIAVPTFMGNCVLKINSGKQE